MPFHLRFRMLFCDWHMPNFLPEVAIDYDEYFAQIRRTGAESLIFQVKTAHGAAFAPTEVGIVNRNMTGDLFGEVAHRAKAAGLEFIAYYNMVLSWELGRLHPEWSQISADGRPLRMFLYPCSCMSNDAFREHVAAHMAEVTARYPIDGWFLDLQYFSPEGCFCPACREKFVAQTGYALEPEAFGTAQWLDLLDYQVHTREAFIHYAQERCNAVKPGLSWSWNGCGSPLSISATLDEGADYLSTEAHPPAYLHADHATRYCEGLGKPFTLFMPESQGSWGDWTVTTPATMKGLSALALSHGGSLNINHVPYPCGDHGGRVPQVVWDTIAETFDFVAAREHLCQGRKPVPVVAVLHSAANARLLQAMTRAGLGGHWGGATYANEHALTQLLMETHIPWEIRPESLALSEMRRYELLILPYLPHVPDGPADKLQAYVDAGGKLLVNYHTSLFGPRGERLPDFALGDLLGVEFVADSPYSLSYLDRLDKVFRPEVPDMPLVIKDVASGEMNPANHALYCRPRNGTRVLAWLTDPIIESNFETGYYVYHDHAPPGFGTEYPGLTINTWGQGQVAYFPVPFLAGYGRKRCPFLQALFRKLVAEVLGVSARFRMEAPPSIRSSLMQDDEGWLLHLVHIQQQTDSMYLTGLPCREPVHVRVRPEWPVSAVRDALTGETLEMSQEGQWAAFTVPGVADHTIVRIGKG
ncbi:MAG: hypothetical protein HPY69_08355 [Armatimonadetes bacterium]|nr:hypothetical protein [Armatimonadota bacterium]